jgi:hypothetical protein
MPTHSTSRRWATTLGATALIAALAPAALAADCDPLVSHTPTGSQGDTAAVAITSQALAADVAGWERVGWQAAADTTVTAVTLVREDGTEQRTDGDLAQGIAEHVTEVRFCGTTHAGTEAASTDEDAVVQVTAAADKPAPAPNGHQADDQADDPADDRADDQAQATGEPEPAAPAHTGTTDGAEAPSEPDVTDEADQADARQAPTRSGAEHEPDGPQRAERGDDTGTHDPTVEQATLAAVEQATLAAAVQEPGAPLAGGAVGLLAGLVVFAGAKRHRTKEERR